MGKHFFGPLSGLWLHAAGDRLPNQKPGRAGDSVPAPLSAVDGAADLLTVLKRRRSVRFFSEAPIERETVERILAHLDRPQPLAGLSTHVVAERVTGVERGAYLWRPGGGWTPVAGTTGAPFELRSLCYQPHFWSAPALLLFSMPLVATLADEGERGYRQTLMRVGQALERSYLAAAALDVAGCATGSLFQIVMDRWLFGSSAGQTVLMGFALGYPQASSANEGTA